jgi:hypothetical protein
VPVLVVSCCWSAGAPDPVLLMSCQGTFPPMDRKAILDKIAAMLALQESSTFEGEASAAAEMIDKLCKKYGVSVDDVNTPQVMEEEYKSYRKIDNSELILFTAVATFYDASPIVSISRISGRAVSTLTCVGTEAQQIQTKAYYDFFLSVMNKECDLALEGEKVIAMMNDRQFDGRGFRSQYKKAFAARVNYRLGELKTQRADHEHKGITKQYTDNIANLKERKTKHTFNTTDAAMLGRVAGNDVSLHKQAGGSKTLALSGS